MQKQAPSVGRIAVMAGFILSCFGLLLFLWAAFGGPIPLRPEGYRITADFPDAQLLAKEADVRIAGVSVGKVKQLSLGDDRTRATIQLKDAYAPLPENAKAILRQKTLLGETYIELTPGDRRGPMLKEGGHLARTQVKHPVEIDEIFQALDAKTRESFRDWLKYQGQAISGRGQDLNDAFGSLGPFVDDANGVLTVLDHQQDALKLLVRNTGEVFKALSERDTQLRSLIENSNDTFEATASRDKALRETFKIFPTFLDESKATLARLETFSTNANPVIRDLKPAATELEPTLKAARNLAPDLKQLFIKLNPLIDSSKAGLPALRKLLDNLGPLLGQLDPFLANLNPVLRYLTYNKEQITDFLAGPPAGIAGYQIGPNGEKLHYLRQESPVGAETLAIWPQRLPSNRGNGYLQPGNLLSRKTAEYGIYANWDCKPSGGEKKGERVQSDTPNCYVQDPYPADFGGKQHPILSRDR
jgi:phospholipid/cholesterol/gamma-HCH transport system substrate-binding protein